MVAFLLLIIKPAIAQPGFGTHDFVTGGTVVLASSDVCTANRSATYLGFQFTLRSGANCAMNNAVGGGSNGHINFITTPLTTGIWQEGRIASSDGSEFRLSSFQFGVLTTPFLNKTITVTGYRNGVFVTGATAVSPVITATGLTNVYEVDVSANSAFFNIDEIRLVPSGSDAQGTFSLLSITLATPIVVLPLNFVEVKAAITGAAVDVVFATANESNVKEYAVQVSADGINFVTQGILPAKNEASNVYRSIVSGIFGKNYIRVQSTDQDGAKKYSHTVLAGTLAKTTLTVFPNPTVGLVLVSGPSQNKPFSILDMQGRYLRTGIITNGQLDMRSFEPGMYLVRIDGQNFMLKKQ